jgi:hypothetical protein
MLESKLKPFKNMPSKKELIKSWEYLLQHHIDQEIIDLLIPWEILNEQKNIQHSTSRGDLYNMLQNHFAYNNDDDEVKVQVQSILAKFKKTLSAPTRVAYKNEMQNLLDQGVIKSGDTKLTNGSYVRFNKEDLARLDYGDEQKPYDYENHTSFIAQTISEIFGTVSQQSEEAKHDYHGEFLEWGMYGYDQNGEFEVLNILKSTEPEEGCVSPRSQNNCYKKRFLYESDNLSLAAQKELMDKLIEQGVLYRAVYSGSKSIHLVVEIDQECESIEEYKFFWNKIAENIGIDLNNTDKAVRDNSRLTRRPGIMRPIKSSEFATEAYQLFAPSVDMEKSTIEQKLLYDGFNVYECYAKLHNEYIKSKIVAKPITIQTLNVYGDGDRDIDKFITNYANKHGLNWTDGNRHFFAAKVSGACKTAGFDLDEAKSVFESMYDCSDDKTITCNLFR